MSASVIQPLTPGRVHGPAGARRGSALRPLRKILLVGLLLNLAGCSTGKGVALEPVTTPSSSVAAAMASPTASPTPVDEQQAILSQYRLFWSSLTPISKLPAAQRRGALSRTTVDPELKSLLAGMATIDRRGQVYFGADVPRATRASISPASETAVVDDCQDSTGSGLARRSDLARLTKGVLRNHVVVTMKKSSTGWKVYFVAYTKTPC